VGDFFYYDTDTATDNVMDKQKPIDNEDFILFRDEEALKNSAEWHPSERVTEIALVCLANRPREYPCFAWYEWNFGHCRPVYFYPRRAGIAIATQPEARLELVQRVLNGAEAFNEVTALGAIQLYAMEVNRLQARLQYALDRVPTEHGSLAFPDGYVAQASGKATLRGWKRRIFKTWFRNLVRRLTGQAAEEAEEEIS
jgi:hypothetical protein